MLDVFELFCLELNLCYCGFDIFGLNLVVLIKKV